MTTRISTTGDISTREWEVLSAYLDERLSPQESAALEKRLEENANLHSSLEDLRRTRSLLRDIPRMRAPRNFTLTPEMAGLRPGVRSLPTAYPVLRLTSVLATVFFVLLSISQVMFVGKRATSVAQLKSWSMVTSEVELEMPPGSLFGGEGGESSSADTEAPTVATEAPPVEAPLAAAPELPTSVAMEKMVGEDSQATSEANTLVVTPLGLLSTSTPPPELDVADQVVSATEEISGQILTPEGTAPALRELRQMTAVTWGWSFLKAIQVFLAFLAVGTGLAAIWLRRSVHE